VRGSGRRSEHLAHSVQSVSCVHDDVGCRCRSSHGRARPHSLVPAAPSTVWRFFNRHAMALKKQRAQSSRHPSLGRALGPTRVTTAPDVVALRSDASKDGLGGDGRRDRVLHAELKLFAENPALCARAPRESCTGLIEAHGEQFLRATLEEVSGLGIVRCIAHRSLRVLSVTQPDLPAQLPVDVLEHSGVMPRGKATVHRSRPWPSSCAASSELRWPNAVPPHPPSLSQAGERAMTISVRRPDHDRCSPRMCEPYHARYLPGVRSTSSHERKTGGSCLGHSHPAITTASPARPTDLVSGGSPSLDARARN
jgi:hypothetical protein